MINAPLREYFGTADDNTTTRTVILCRLIDLTDPLFCVLLSFATKTHKHNRDVCVSHLDSGESAATTTCT